jgi:hypothetical protein
VNHATFERSFEPRARRRPDGASTIGSRRPADLRGDVLFARALAAGSFAGVMVVSAAEFLATLGEA